MSVIDLIDAILQELEGVEDKHDLLSGIRTDLKRQQNDIFLEPPETRRRLLQQVVDSINEYVSRKPGESDEPHWQRVRVLVLEAAAA